MTARGVIVPVSTRVSLVYRPTPEAAYHDNHADGLLVIGMGYAETVTASRVRFFQLLCSEYSTIGGLVLAPSPWPELTWKVKTKVGIFGGESVSLRAGDRQLVIPRCLVRATPADVSYNGSDLDRLRRLQEWVERQGGKR